MFRLALQSETYGFLRTVAKQISAHIIYLCDVSIILINVVNTPLLMARVKLMSLLLPEGNRLPGQFEDFKG